MEASRASRAWRARILDSRLWKEKFKTEGWNLDTEEIERFERKYNLQKTTNLAVPARRTPRGPGSFRSRSLKAPKFQNSQQKDRTSLFDGLSGVGLRRALSGKDGEANTSQGTNTDEEMPDADDESLIPRKQTQNLDSDSSDDPSPKATDQKSSLSPETRLDQGSPQEESMMNYVSPGSSRLNYHYVFKQKRRLEENWNAGRYKSFQLPHRDHPEDAHTECVYTIQYLGKYLVSGSRDRTLRIWDLDTQRLARKPLQGHLGSVLCLQFDDANDEDIIISGSSDCHVIIWRFSTGQKIQQLTNAHRESVLNLRFDKRFLVTCSKDKTIKIWNRQEIKPGDRNYPIKGAKGGGQCPSYIIDMVGIPNALKYGPSKPEHLMLLEPYTHIMTLELHVAAVNAIQIYEDQLVSASGDRCLRVWDIHSGECSTKIEAHLKGIACVQYDGKRIVSGSSDNTIRIWDPVSHIEVARLEGHSRLVRTIQAAFVDVPGGRERLGAEAAEVEHQYHLAKEAGKIPPPSRRDPPGRPGSRRPKDLRGINAKIPPSGGGSRWSHIVSGSYDETVIVWKKTEDDEWVIGHRLRQEEALTAAGPELLSRSEQIQADRAPLVQHTAAPNPANPNVGVQGPFAVQQHQTIAQASANPWTQQDPNQLSVTAPPTFALPGGGHHHPAPATVPPLRTVHQLLNPTTNPNTTHPLTGYVPPANPPAPNWHPAAWQGTVAQPHTQPPTQAQGQPQTQPHTQQQGPPLGRPGPPRPNLNPANAQNQQAGAGGQPNARVFKLQFDARRIICCSQDPKIVGWDFANGDEQIMECSKFFAAPQ